MEHQGNVSNPFYLYTSGNLTYLCFSKYIIKPCKPGEIQKDDIVEITFCIRAYKKKSTESWTVRPLLRGILLLEKKLRVVSIVIMME